MSDITYRSDLTRDLTPNEVDANFRSLNDTKAETTVTEGLAQNVALLEIAQEQFTSELATQGAAIAALDSNVANLTNRMTVAETDIDALEIQTAATEQALQLHEMDHQNPHQVTAEQTGADVAGTAAALMQVHLATPDPHPQYLTPGEGDTRYDPLGAAAAAQGSANAISLDGLPAVMDGGQDGFLLKITGTPGNEQIVAVPASTVATPTQVAKRWFSVATEVIGPTTYNLGADVEPVGLSTTKTNTVTTANTENLIAEFVSNATTTGFTVDPGLWSFKLWDRASSAGNELRIKIFILNQVTFGRTQVGVTHTYPLDNVIDEFDTYELSVAAPVVIAPGQRLLFSLYSFSTANNRTLTISFGGADRQSYLELPLAAAHNNLAGLQGGGGTERYHLSAAERGAVQAMVGAAYVLAAGSTPDGEWRQWSDGKIEQWGVYLVGDMASDSDASTTIPLPIAYPDQSFQSLMSIEMLTGNKLDVYRAGGDLDPSRIAVNIENAGTAATAVKVHWRAMSV